MVRITEENFFDDVASAFADGDAHVAQKLIESDHVRCVQLIYHAVARGAFDEMLQLTTDDFTLEIFGPEDSPLVGTWRGRAEVLAAVNRNFAHFAEQTPHVQTVVAQGDTVVVIASEQGKLVATGNPYHVHWVHIFSFAGDRVAKIRQMFDGVDRCGLSHLP
jgi:ketosteroid isomerase-like protein